MDERCRGVRAVTRSERQGLVLELWQEIRPTVVFVTHDIEEAIYLSEQVVVMSRAPAQISEVVGIDLPHPRHQIETKEHPMYLDYRRHILGEIMAETRPADALAGASAR